MAKNDINSVNQIKCIVSPHGGYAYCGPTMGWGYKYLKKNIDPNTEYKVFILGAF